MIANVKEQLPKALAWLLVMVVYLVLIYTVTISATWVADKLDIGAPNRARMIKLLEEHHCPK